MLYKPAKYGFTLIEIVISLFILLIIISSIISIAGTYSIVRRSSLETIAGKIASSQIETLRQTDLSVLSCQSPTGCPLTISELPDLSQLPTGASGKQFIDLHAADPNIHDVTVQINWQVNGANRSVSFSTIIYNNGLN